MELENKVSGYTKVLGIIGNPIGHSISPHLHNSISKHLGIDLIYVPFKVEANELENAIKGLKALNVLGFNVTIPYKEKIIGLIDEISKEALMIGAVNTVKNIDGKLYGYNTDAEGFLTSFQKESGTGFEGKKVVIIGAGGAARAIAIKVALEGARDIFIFNRTISKALEISNTINTSVNSIAKSLRLDDDNIEDIIKQSDVIINTTSVGMYPNIEENPIGHTINFSSNHIVYDVIYNPIKTKFLRQAEERGCKAINGLGMLFYQGIYAYEIWTDNKVPEKLRQELLVPFNNIVL